ncbi:hypothetical protein BU25DRAFT_413026 [Macroventuria anomochaeta]|uniref:Uncharacterized protein n=1 Tax=Macroventuria anomochaeta TaxID=301207 RepID=A0ACB6RS20_9PLEO|nr:uncharacterized protein BU25DRAFT_413026 [Macroventuria anomochaeta]KAF2624846.1 hypothetical protein BU25DRAFT_413026 [Macroventuria anomochaeta]
MTLRLQHRHCSADRRTSSTTDLYQTAATNQTPKQSQLQHLLAAMARQGNHDLPVPSKPIQRSLRILPYTQTTLLMIHRPPVDHQRSISNLFEHQHPLHQLILLLRQSCPFSALQLDIVLTT